MENVKQKLRRSVLYLLGFSAFPLLTSCYGTPQDYEYKEPINGRILMSDGGSGIEGIRISYYRNAADTKMYETYSDSRGKFVISERDEMRSISFEDVDGDANGGDFKKQTMSMKDLESGSIYMKLK